MSITSDQFSTPAPKRGGDIHIGTGMELEIDCGCPLELCGLVNHRQIHTQCKIHGSKNNIPMPVWHTADLCPGFTINYGE